MNFTFLPFFILPFLFPQKERWLPHTVAESCRLLPSLKNITYHLNTGITRGKKRYWGLQQSTKN